MDLLDTFIEIFSKAPKVSGVERTMTGFDFRVESYPSGKKNWYINCDCSNPSFVSFYLRNGFFPIVFNLKTIKKIKPIDAYILDYSDEILDGDIICNIVDYPYQYIIFEYEGEIYKFNKNGFYHIENIEKEK